MCHICWELALDYSLYYLELGCVFWVEPACWIFGLVGFLPERNVQDSLIILDYVKPMRDIVVAKPVFLGWGNWVKLE